MTTQEIRARLKHCAGLLYAISCDLNNDNDELEQLREEVQHYRNGGTYKKQRKLSPEERERRSQAMRDMWKRRREKQQQQKPTITHEVKPTNTGET